MTLYMLKSHEWVKDPSKLQHRPTGFNVTEYKKFINMVQDSAMEQTFKKLPLIELGIISNKNNYLKKLFSNSHTPFSKYQGSYLCGGRVFFIELLFLSDIRNFRKKSKTMSFFSLLFCC